MKCDTGIVIGSDGCDIAVCAISADNSVLSNAGPFHCITIKETASEK